jgi:hypothetical protein
VFQQQSGGGGGRSLSDRQDAIVPVSPDTDSDPDRLINSPPGKVKPYPGFHSNADRDPAFYSNADPDLAAKNIYSTGTVPELRYFRAPTGFKTTCKMDRIPEPPLPGSGPGPISDECRTIVSSLSNCTNAFFSYFSLNG